MYDKNFTQDELQQLPLHTQSLQSMLRPQPAP